MHRQLSPLVFSSLFLTLASLSAQGPIGSITLGAPGDVPVGIERLASGEILYTSLGTPESIGRADRQGAVRSSFAIDTQNSAPLGVTVAANGDLFVTDAAADEVDRFDANGNYVSSFSVPSSFPEGITYSANTGNLYVVDGTAPQVFEFDLAGNLLATRGVAGSSLDGIAWDSTTDTFWIYDSGTDRLRQYGANFVEQASFAGPIAAGFGAGEGVGVNGTQVWVVVPGSRELVFFDSTGSSQASVTRYGMGCPTGLSFYELFSSGRNDLSGNAIEITPNANGFAVTAASTGFNTALGTNLNMSDDSTRRQPLGFTMTWPGIGPVSTIDIDSNGRIGPSLGGSIFTEDLSTFLSTPMIAVLWDDLDPSSGGGVFFSRQTGVTTVTWNQVPQFGSSDRNTVQAQFYADGRIILVWVQVRDDSIVGYSVGNGVDPGAIDISAAVPFSGASGRPVDMNSTAPVLGGNATLTVSQLPPGTVAATFVLGVSRATTPLDSIGMPACVLHVSPGAFLPGVANRVSVPIPLDVNLISSRFFGQAFVVAPGVNQLGVAASNGVQFDVGT